MKYHHKKLSYSEFTRDKLHEDYNPQISVERYNHFIDINRKRRFMEKVKDEQSTSNKALSEIKKGKYLEIDLNTRQNFKAVTELRVDLEEDYEWTTDKYRKATMVLMNDLEKIRLKKKSLHQKIKASRSTSLMTECDQLPIINKNSKIPVYKIRVLKRQKELLKLYPLKYLKPQLLQKFHEIYSEII